MMSKSQQMLNLPYLQKKLLTMIATNNGCFNFLLL
jgi:hypothetical protein